MRWDVEVDEALPTLAWSARVSSDAVEVVCGATVLLGDGWLHDGAWAGPIDSPPAPSTYSTGTGLVLEGASVTVITSDTPRDRVLAVTEGDTTRLSNSLPLLLAAVGDSLDPRDMSVGGRFRSMERSLRRSCRTFRTAHGRTIRAVVGETARIEGGTSLRTEPRPNPAPFTSFEDYRSRLRTAAGALISNANDPSRPVPFEPVVAMSGGYDATAVAAAVAEHGVRAGVTLVRNDDPATDHAGDIARHLGIELQDVRRGAWLGGSGRPEAELAAASVSLMDTVFLGLEAEMPGRIVFTGASGDALWGRSLHRATNGDVVVPSGAMGGRGLVEHRLRVGYVMCALADFGHSAHRSLVRIGRSPEMAPWSVGGSYDRPIARRIAEEAGVPREAFGIRKHTANAGVGISNHVYSGRTRAEREAELADVMSPAAIESFLDFVEGHEDTRARLHLAGRRFLAGLDRITATFDVKVFGPIAERGVPVRVPRRVSAFLGRWGRGPIDHTAWLPHWGTRELVRRLPPAERAASTQRPPAPRSST